MNTYALIRNGIVENILVWDGLTVFPLETGCELKRADYACINEPWADSMIEAPIINTDQPIVDGAQTF